MKAVNVTEDKDDIWFAQAFWLGHKKDGPFECMWFQLICFVFGLYVEYTAFTIMKEKRKT